jgi:hypothetical protein
MQSATILASTSSLTSQQSQNARSVVAATTVVDTNTSSISTPPVVRYQFHCSVDNKPIIVTESLMGDLKVIREGDDSIMPDSLSCPYHQFVDGVQSTELLQSNRTVSSLSKSFENATALVVETWITPIFSALDVAKRLPIVSIAQQQLLSTNTISGDCDGVELSLVQWGNQLEIRYRDYYNYLPPLDDEDRNYKVYGCRVLHLKEYTLRYQELHQIVITWKAAGSILEIHINGDELVSINLLGRNNDDGALFPSSSLYDIQSWDPTYTLQVFGNQLTSSVYTGMIHQVSMYNQSLSKDEMNQLYQNGVNQRNQKFIFDPSNPLNLVASPVDVDKEATLIQGRSVVMGIGGDFNTSTPYWDVFVEIMELPKYGDLLTLNGKTVGRVGDRILVDAAQSRTRVMYRQKVQDYFSVPRYSFNGTALLQDSESFIYRLIAVDKDDSDQIFGRSEPIEQEVQIVHRNHPPELDVQDEITKPHEQPKGIGSRPWANIDRAVLHDDNDYNIDRVRVDLWTYNGTLSIESDALREMADFESCASRSTSMLSNSPGFSWHCHGKGKNDRNMTFLATPGDVTSILSDIRYDAFYWNQEDTIVVRVFDGSGGPCLKEEEHLIGRSLANNSEPGIPTVHEDCFQIVHAIRVPPLNRPIDPNDLGVNGFFNELFDVEGFGIPDLIFWIIVIITTMACCFCCCTIRKCLCSCIRRRATAVIHVDDIPPTRTLPDLEGGPIDDDDLKATVS